MRQWLIHSSDGTPRGPASTTDIARAVHAGILDRLHHVAPTGSPEEWKPVASIREIDRAITELGFPENDEGDAALRTLIASPAELATLEAELAGEAVPDSMEGVRRLEPTAHAAPRARAAAAAAQRAPLAPLDDNPDSEPRTLVVRSPFDEVGARAELAPVYVVMPKAGTPTGQRSALATDAESVAAAERREVEEAATVVATAPRIVPPRPSRAEITASGLAAGSRATMASSRRRTYIALAFAFGLVGGLTMVLLAYAFVGP